ncbi:MAG: PilN domain-containing protein [Myxococcales bacterium]|nr:PilN domain-containing protein [Myxococcales bacterium]MDP3504582.1 PilN domain-containing protein [Myxococcales bacterium]
MTAIRINLLPVRQVKKREMGRQFLVLVAGSLIIAGAGNYYWYATREAERTRVQDQVTETQRRIDALEKQIGEVNDLKKRKKEVEDKLAILDKLKKQRSGPVKLLDALSSAIPKKVFVADFDEKANSVRVTGTGESHEDVSEFMRSLANVVWTPKGIGRVVERKRDARNVRVELLSAEGAIEDFEVKDLSNFFTGVELKQSEQFDNKGKPNVKFELGMTANYAT